ncbi:MAG: hypothetical protein WC683_07655 [bacterium]|jgi:hypothetical protein
MRQPETVEDLIAWFRRTVLSVPYGEVGIVAYLRDGQVATIKRIYNETKRIDGQIESSRVRETVE